MQTFKPSRPSTPSTAGPGTSDDLTLICGTCHLPVGDYDGYLYVSVTAAMDLFTAREERPRGPATPAQITGGDVIAFVQRRQDAAWRVTHNRCDTRPDFLDDYHIRPETIRTWQDLAYWSAHLFSKRWFRFTDWDGLMREVAGVSPAERIQVTRRAAA